jgi:hypothetical protein
MPELPRSQDRDFSTPIPVRSAAWNAVRFRAVELLVGYRCFQNSEDHGAQIDRVPRAEAFNIFNHAGFYVGNETSNPTRFTVNNTTFGKITAVFTDARRLQLGL